MFKIVAYAEAKSNRTETLRVSAASNPDMAARAQARRTLQRREARAQRSAQSRASRG